MAELATIARPYAEATFRSALEADRLGSVADGLAYVAAIARDPQMHAALMNPKVSPAQKKEIFANVAGAHVDDISRNLVAMLIDGHREVLVGDIVEQFEALKREHEKVVVARITSAQPLSDSQRGEIVAALEKRYGKKVEAEMDVDPELLGGARVQVGDQVIHASVRDALAQMAAALTR
jgi:F-type H+-transporting ATPase subunit delta